MTSENANGREQMLMVKVDHSLENLVNNEESRQYREEAAGSNEDVSRGEIPGHI